MSQQGGVRNFDKVSSEGFTKWKSEGSEGAELAMEIIGKTYSRQRASQV